MKTFVAFLALVAALIFAPSLADTAQAQPCQWNYTAPNNYSTATYCGDVYVNGVIHTINANVVNNIAALEAVSKAGANTYYTVLGYSSVNDGGGGGFYYTSTACNNAGAGDSGTQFPATAVGSGCWIRALNNGQPYNVQWFGALCTGVQTTDGVSTSGSATITSAAARWGNVKPGWVAVVNKAASSGQQLVTTVASVTNASTVVLATTAGASGTAEIVTLYPNDTTALNAALDAAGASSVAVILPTQMSCGYANPGTGTIKTTSAAGIYLNGGTLWLGQTGPVVDSGVGIQLNANGSFLIGPGTVDGLYQTNQAVAQFNTPAFIFNTQNDARIDNVTIQNTKGPSFNTGNVNNFTISNLTVRSCGDFSYQHSSTLGDMFGRPNCAQIIGATGSLNISNFTGYNAAQAPLAILQSTDPLFHANLSNLYFQGNGYYGLDVEEFLGAMDVTNARQAGNGQTPSGVLVYGGMIFRDVPNLNVSNYVSTATDNNAFVALSNDAKADLSTWNFSNFAVSGTANHRGQIFVAFNGSGTPQKVSLSNIQYDTLTLAAAGNTCVATNPRLQLIQFTNINASGLDPGTQTIFNPNGGNGEWTYVLGQHSYLGTVAYTTLGNQFNYTFGLDLFDVQMNGSPTIGNVAVPKYIAPTLTNPQTSFTC